MNKLSIFKKKVSKGFTLIELLIVIAVIGVLAAVILVAIDPVEQLARGKDAGRKSSITQLGRAAQAFYTNNSAYPTAAQWTTAPYIVVTTGDVKVFPTNPTYGAAIGACAAGNVLGYCYDLNGASTEIRVFARLESKTEIAKCTVAGTVPWYVWDSATGGPIPLPAGCLGAGVEPVLP